MKRWLILLICCAACFSVWAIEEEGPTVREIEIRFVGPETVNRAIVRANIQTSVGKSRLHDTIEQDVRALIGTGFFLDVRVLEEQIKDGVRVVYQVTGKASLKEITVEGGKLIRNERLKREVKLKVGDVLDERKAHESAAKMVEVYQKAGFPDAKVEPISSIDRDTGKAILKFKVTEADRVFIKAIQITGNKSVKAPVLLKLVKTKRRWWGSWMAGSGVLKDEQFVEDLEKIRDHYRSKGYIDVEIKETRIERVGKQWLIVHINLFEGQQYKIGTVKIEGSKLFPATQLQKLLKMTSGKVFTPDGLSKDIKALEDYYGGRGYLDTRINSKRDANVETGQLDLIYTLQEGELTYIEKIVIRGNTKTKDKVIRRELAVAPGDIYNTVKVDASKERLKNLGYFSKIDATPEPTSIPNHRDVAIQLEEQRTGNVTFGAGFSSVDNLMGFVEVSQGNFDLFNWPSFTGAGQKARVRMQLGLKRQDYIISLAEPWFLDQRLLLGWDLFHTQSSYLSSEFSEQRTGTSLRLEKALNDFLRAQAQYTIQDINYGVSDTASEELQSQSGSRLRSSMLLSLVHDMRDSVFLTTRGMRSELSVELAGGPLGGNVADYKLNAKSTIFFPFFDKQVLQILGAIGTVSAFGSTEGSGGTVTEIDGSTVKVNDVPLFDRYFLGGANSLRGFTYGSVGPKDVNGQPVGGNTTVNAMAEYSIPVVERVRVAVFFDIGEVERNSYSFSVSDIKSDAGLGVRLNLPVGPLRLDYGYPIQTDSQTGKTGKIQFSSGFQF
ncbi:MAG: outer membrane protein assembly factor BamA [Verrucomicrobiota bacterium]